MSKPFSSTLRPHAAVASASSSVHSWSASAGRQRPPPTTPNAPSTEPPTPPVAVEEFTRLDADTAVRGRFTDTIAATIDITHEGMAPVTVDIDDPSHVAVTRMTFQPGAQAPWHTHNGPVIVSVVQGELLYVMSDCSKHSYPAGSAFVDPGHGTVHSGYNPTDGLTVVVNTFLEAPADGPLSITEGVSGPTDNCGLPTPPSYHRSAMRPPIRRRHPMVRRRTGGSPRRGVDVRGHSGCTALAALRPGRPIPTAGAVPPGTATLRAVQRILSDIVHAGAVPIFVGSTAGNQYRPAVEYRVLGPLEVLADGQRSRSGDRSSGRSWRVLVAAAVGRWSRRRAAAGDLRRGRRAEQPGDAADVRLEPPPGLLGDVIVRQGDALPPRLHGRDDRRRRVRGRVPQRHRPRRCRRASRRGCARPWRCGGATRTPTSRPTASSTARSPVSPSSGSSALEARIDADMRAGRHREVVAELDALTVEHPFRETPPGDAHARPVSVGPAGGGPARVRAHQRRRWSRVSGIDPSPELQELERRILEQDREPAARRRPDGPAAGGARRRPRRRRLVRSGGARDRVRPARVAAGIRRRPRDGRQAGAEGHGRVRGVRRADPRRAGRPGRWSTSAPGWPSTSATSRCATTSRSARRWPGPPGWSPSPIPARCCCRRRRTTR